MTIADYLIKQINNGSIKMNHPSKVYGMGEKWDFIPDRKYGPGHLINSLTGTILSVADISLREIDANNNDWQVIHNNG